MLNLALLYRVARGELDFRLLRQGDPVAQHAFNTLVGELEDLEAYGYTHRVIAQRHSQSGRLEAATAVRVLPPGVTERGFDALRAAGFTIQRR